MVEARFINIKIVDFRTPRKLYLSGVFTLMEASKQSSIFNSITSSIKSSTNTMRAFLLFYCSLSIVAVTGQTPQIDSLKHLLARHRNDTASVLLFRALGRSYLDARPDSCYFYTSQGLSLAEKLHYEKGQTICLSLLGMTLNKIGNMPQALAVSLLSLERAERLKDPLAIGDACNSLGIIYFYQRDYSKALYYYLAALRTTRDAPGAAGHRVAVALGNVGEDYLWLGMPDSCRQYMLRAWKIFLGTNDPAGVAFALSVLGESYTRSGRDSLAMNAYQQAISLEMLTNDRDDLCHSLLGMATIFRNRRSGDSAAWYARRSLTIADTAGFDTRELDAVNFLADQYGSEKNSDSALKFLRLAIALKDSLYSREKSTAIQAMTFQENIRQQQLVVEKHNAELNAARNRQRAGIAAFIPLFFLFVLFLYRKKVKPRLVEFLAVVGLLLAFEFITDLIFPYISDWTNDSPLWETVILVAVAAAIEPLNYRIEGWLNVHLTRTNLTREHAKTAEELKG
jgi:tetratricopeptide (TPR) repeat protein